MLTSDDLLLCCEAQVVLVAVGMSGNTDNLSSEVCRANAPTLAAQMVIRCASTLMRSALDETFASYKR